MLAAFLPRVSRWNVAIALYAVVALAALAGLLAVPGTVGHHWDWLIPSDPAELRRLASIEGTSWQDYAFGSYVSFRYATIFTSLLFGLPGFVGLGGDFVSKTLIGLSFFVSALSMRFLLLSLPVDGERTDRDGVVATLCGLLYMLAPYAYHQIIAGDQSALISDALAPLALALAVRCVLSRNRAWLAYGLGAALLFATIIASVQVFVFTVGVMAVVGLAVRWSLESALRLAFVAISSIALCAFWLMPVLLAGGAVHTVVQTSPIADAFATLQQFSNPIMTVTMLAFPGYFYWNALGWGAAFYFAAFAAMVALGIYALARHRTRLLVALAVVYAIVVIAPLGGNPVVGPLIVWLFKILLPYSLFLRTPQHLMFVVSLVVPMLAFLAFRAVPARASGIALAAAAVIVVAYGQGFFTHGNFLGLIGPYRETAGERATASIVQSPADAQYRTLWVPNSPGYYYHPGIFDYYFEGGDEPQIRFLPATTLGAGVKWSPYDRTQLLLKALDELVPDGADPQTQAMLLKMTSVKYLIVHGIGTPSAGVRNVGDNDRLYLETALKQTGIASQQATYDDRSLWRFSAPVPRIYSPDCLFGVPRQADPYDVLALAGASAGCLRPATLVSDARHRSEYIVSPLQFHPDRRAVSTPSLFSSNVATELDSGRSGFFMDVPAGVQDVLIVRAGKFPARTRGIRARMYANAERRVYLQLLAPDTKNAFQATVYLRGRVLDVALDFSKFGRIGNPDRNDIRYVRFASDNGTGRDVQMYVGNIAPLVDGSSTRSVQYLAQLGNRWDRYYFGGDRFHPALVPLLGNPPAYAQFYVGYRGTYDLVAHVQDTDRELSMQAAVDGSPPAPCSTTVAQTDETERLVHLARVQLTAGRHNLEVRYCGGMPAHWKSAGIQSVNVAAAKMQPPAEQTIGTARVLEEHPGSIRLRAFDFHVVFTDSFDPRWIATQNGLELPHFVANGYANGWYVPDPSKGDVLLTFWPQQAFQMGITVSLVLVALALLTIAAVSISLRVRGRKPVADRVNA